MTNEENIAWAEEVICIYEHDIDKQFKARAILATCHQTRATEREQTWWQDITKTGL